MAEAHGAWDAASGGDALGPETRVARPPRQRGQLQGREFKRRLHNALPFPRPFQLLLHRSQARAALGRERRGCGFRSSSGSCAHGACRSTVNPACSSQSPGSGPHTRRPAPSQPSRDSGTARQAQFKQLRGAGARSWPRTTDTGAAHCVWKFKMCDAVDGRPSSGRPREPRRTASLSSSQASMRGDVSRETQGPQWHILR